MSERSITPGYAESKLPYDIRRSTWAKLVDPDLRPFGRMKAELVYATGDPNYIGLLMYNMGNEEAPTPWRLPRGLMWQGCVKPADNGGELRIEPADEHEMLLTLRVLENGILSDHTRLTIPRSTVIETVVTSYGLVSEEMAQLAAYNELSSFVEGFST